MVDHAQKLLQSQWVRQEIDRAITAWSQSKLILVTLDKTPLPPGLRDLEAVDLSPHIKSDPTHALNQLASALVHRKAALEAKSIGPERLQPPAIASQQLPTKSIVGAALGGLLSALVLLPIVMYYFPDIFL